MRVPSAENRQYLIKPSLINEQSAETHNHSIAETGHFNEDLDDPDYLPSENDEHEKVMIWTRNEDIERNDTAVRDDCQEINSTQERNKTEETNETGEENIFHGNAHKEKDKSQKETCLLYTSRCV